MTERVDWVDASSVDDSWMSGGGSLAQTSMEPSRPPSACLESVALRAAANSSGNCSACAGGLAMICIGFVPSMGHGSVPPPSRYWTRA